MRARIVRIGNSRGVRIPKVLLEEAGLGEHVELSVREGEIIVSPVERPRRNWGEAARELARQGGDPLPEEPDPTRFDEEEWSW